MLYKNHGIGVTFETQTDYFGDNVNDDAVTYLQLANTLIHQLNEDYITIAEDVSGMPGCAANLDDFGMGFDYRMAMGAPDYWFKLAEEVRDDDWSMGGLYYELTNHRREEKTVNYVESHDQALVGGKTFFFQLADAAVYYGMGKDQHSEATDRAVALHKMARLATFALNGGAYLNFMGNEFGHPEWIDFPRKGNNWSYFYARRQWSLITDKALKYDYLLQFDKAMLAFTKLYNVFNSGFATLLQCDEDNKTIVFSRGRWVAVFNWHAMSSVADYAIPVEEPGKYRLVLSTDDVNYGGFDRLDITTRYFSYDHKKKHYIKIYNINRSASVYEKV
jgi:1,4-alpha-glucan branching enzyme